MSPKNESTTPSMSRQILYGLANWALLLAGLTNLVVGTWAAIQENAPVSATSLTAGLVLLFAATIDRFESLKGLGVEAKTRQLDQKIIQADEALHRLRELAELTGRALIDFNSKMGRWDSAPRPRDSIAFASHVRRVMMSMGSDERVIAQALRPWAKMLCFDMAKAQTKVLGKMLQERQKLLQSERQKIKQPHIEGGAEHAALSEEIHAVTEFQNRLRNLHLLELEDYPDKFMVLFDEVPHVDAQQIEPLRIAAASFVPGMDALKQTQTLPDSELWIEELNKEKEA